LLLIAEAESDAALQGTTAADFTVPASASAAEVQGPHAPQPQPPWARAAPLRIQEDTSPGILQPY
jgi:hypothetical protein